MIYAGTNKNSGISALPTILLLSGIILEVVVAGLTVSQLFSQSAMGERLSTEALKAAESGAHDAISKVRDYVNCPDVTYCPSLYELVVNEDLDNRVACVSISTISGGIKILSRGRALNRYVTVEVQMAISTTPPSVEVQSFKEIETPSDGTFDSCAL